MKFLLAVPSLLLALAAAASAVTSLKISANSTTRSASEVEANYTTTHLYVDEVAGDSIPITVFFDPGTTGVDTAQVFTNLNRRDRADDDANGDGIHDGILPPSGDSVTAGSDTHYYKAYTMGLVSGGYLLTLDAATAGAMKTGAYRLTARYRLSPAGPWIYYNGDGGHRDHCFVVSPKKARDIVMYEVNPLSIIATGTAAGQRGTFANLAGGVAGGPRFSLSYVKELGVNM